MRRTFGVYFLLTMISLIVLAFLAPAAMAHSTQATADGLGGAFLTFGTIDIFATRTMLPPVMQLKRPLTFLLDTFFKGTKQFNTAFVDIDIYSRHRKMAAFVSPLMEGKVMNRLGKTTNTFTPPYIKPKRPTTVGDLLVAQPGEGVYSPGVTQEQRALSLLMQDIMDLDDAITRREEWMAASALTTGSINVVGDGVNANVNFGQNTAHQVTLTGAALWTATSTANPIKNFTTWANQCRQDSGVNPDTVVMGSAAAAAFIAWISVPANATGGQLSSMKLTLGQIQPTQLAEGVTFLGTLMAPSINVDLYQYDEWYFDEVSQTELPMIPANMVVLGSTRAANNKLYGAIQNVNAVAEMGQGSFSVPRFPSSWTTNDPSVRWLMLESASLVALNQPDAFVNAVVC